MIEISEKDVRTFLKGRPMWQVLQRGPSGRGGGTSPSDRHGLTVGKDGTAILSKNITSLFFDAEFVEIMHNELELELILSASYEDSENSYKLGNDGKNRLKLKTLINVSEDFSGRYDIATVGADWVHLVSSQHMSINVV